MDALILVSNAFIIFKIPVCFSLVLLLNQYKFKMTLFNEVNPFNCDERPEGLFLISCYCVFIIQIGNVQGWRKQMANIHMRYLMMVTMEFIMFEVCANDRMPPYLHSSALPIGFCHPSHFYKLHGPPYNCLRSELEGCKVENKLESTDYRRCTITNFVNSVSTNRADS